MRTILIKSTDSTDSIGAIQQRFIQQRFIRITQILTHVLALVFCLGLSTSLYAHSDPSFPHPQEDFTKHIAEVKRHLLANQMDHRTEEDAELNLPFDLKASTDATYRGKFLLIHGLNDSPYIWRDIAGELTDRGFDVRAILLPGHGTTPEAQLSMSYRRWIKAARQHISFYRDDNTPFYLGGFSLGGVLATYLAGEKDPVDGLLLFSPAYQSTRDHQLRWAGIYSKFKPWVFGGMIREDNPVKYNSIPINAASQYYKTTRRLKWRWPRKKLDVPTLAVASLDDSVLDVDHMIRSFNKGFTGKKKMIMYTNDLDYPMQEFVEYRSSAYPEQRVLNQSHQSVLVAPSNALYGANGSVRVCNGNEWPIFSRCLYYTGTHWLGAQHTPSPDEVPVARVTYNPDFSGVMEEFDELFLR